MHGADGAGGTDRVWGGVQRLRGWLDAEAGSPEAGDVRLLRIFKISEEVGEVAEAVHGALGVNPRKGASHSWGDVEEELADVIVTAMVALATITPRPEDVLDARVRYLVRRALGSGPDVR
ncbi:hypothetical protein EIZ62_31790 [Streptomyces ficellus]|uniref:Uncharacterized protein n=2 Tax=Streptomyces ficellus TaxID=1977088 RepID=A0A6I6FGZ6_9ACTN|nr:MazG-like family protein [Streptomyces ficellus]QGV82970.1 hypothetical protein EIZ62_31790 [Streptomyces ficellus]